MCEQSMKGWSHNDMIHSYCNFSIFVAGNSEKLGRSDKIIYIESYYGGSHSQLMDLLHDEFGGDLYTLPASKWNWRMRISALYFSEIIPHGKKYR